MCYVFRDDAETLSPALLPIANADGFRKNLHVMVWVGDIDSPEFQRQSREYADKLGLLFENVEFWISKDDDHFTIVERLSELEEFSPGGHLKCKLESIIAYEI